MKYHLMPGSVCAALLAAAPLTHSQDVGNILVRFHPTTSSELIESSPAISPYDGAIYFTTRQVCTTQPPSCHGFMYAISTAGQLIQRVDLGVADAHGIISSPAISPEGIFVGNGSRALAYEPLLGVQMWAAEFNMSGILRALVSSTPTIGQDNTVYVATDDSSESGVWALNPLNGDKRHVFDFDSAPGVSADIDCSLALSSDGALYLVGEHNNFVAAVDSQLAGQTQPAQSLIWITGVATDIIEEFFTAAGGKHIRFKAPGSASDSPHFNSSPAIGSDGVVYVGARHGLCSVNRSGDATVFSPRISVEDLTEMRSFRSSPAIGPDGAIYVGCDNGKFYAVQPSGLASGNGFLKWTFTPDWTPSDPSDPCAHRPPILSSPAIAGDNTVYITCSTDAGGAPTPGQLADENDNAVLFALDAQTGAVKWKTLLDGVLSPSSPAIAADGTIWVADMRTMYAIKGASPLANAPWPMFHHDLAHTGRQNAGSCPAVQGLSSTPGIQRVTLTWQPIANATYTVKRAEPGSSIFAVIASGLQATSYVDSGLATSKLRAHSTYTYIVESSCGAASASKPVSATTLPIVVNIQFTDDSYLPHKSGVAAFNLSLHSGSSDFWNVLKSCCDGENNGPGDAGDVYCVDRLQNQTGIRAEFWTTPGISDWPFAMANSGPQDELLQSYMTEDTGSPIYVYLSNLPPGIYDVFLYGTGTFGSRLNSTFSILSGATGSSGVSLDPPKSTSSDPSWDINTWEEDHQFVLFRDQLMNNPMGGSILIKVSGGWHPLNGLQLVTHGLTDCD